MSLEYTRGWGPAAGTKKDHFFKEGRSLCKSFRIYNKDAKLLEIPVKDKEETCHTCLLKAAAEKFEVVQ